jgi:hypothetical protein
MIERKRIKFDSIGVFPFGLQERPRQTSKIRMAERPKVYRIDAQIEFLLGTGHAMLTSAPIPEHLL